MAHRSNAAPTTGMSDMPPEVTSLIVTNLGYTKDTCKALLSYATSSHEAERQVRNMFTTNGVLVFRALQTYYSKSFFKNGLGIESFDDSVRFYRRLYRSNNADAIAGAYVTDARDLDLVENIRRWPNGEHDPWDNAVLESLAERWQDTVLVPPYLKNESLREGISQVEDEDAPAFYRTMIQFTCSDVALSRPFALMGFLLQENDKKIREHLRFRPGHSFHERYGPQYGTFTADSTSVPVLELSRDITHTAMQILNTEAFKNIADGYFKLKVSVKPQSTTLEIYKPHYASMSLHWFKNVCTASFNANRSYYQKKHEELKQPLESQFVDNGDEATLKVILELMKTTCKDIEYLSQAFMSHLDKVYTFVSDDWLDLDATDELLGIDSESENEEH